MWKNHLKIALRTLWKHKFQSSILVVGLAIGLATTYFIGQYVNMEHSYDSFHSKLDRIYRVPITFIKNNESEMKDAANAAPVGPTLKTEFPEIEEFVRFTPEYDRVVFKFRDQQFEEEKVFYVDSSLFDVFDFKLLEGSPNASLNKPFTVVLTQSSAEKYFGKMETWTESPIGKSIRMNNAHNFEVSGILEDVPYNSHIQFDALLSFTSFFTTNEDPSQFWAWNDFWTYILLQEGADAEQLAGKMDAFNERYNPYKQDNFRQESWLQPLAGIHLNSKLGYEFEANGDARTVSFLLLIAIGILFIALANYINLATARANERAAEIGLRKVIGADKKTLIAQFLSEALVINILAVGLAFILIQFGQSGMDWLVGKPLPPLMNLGQWLLVLPLIIGIGSILSGLYPAFLLAAFAPNQTLLKSNSNSGREWFRKSLVVFQYGISVFLIISTIVVFVQLNYMRQQDLGFSLDEKLILKAPTTLESATSFRDQFQSFKNELRKIPEIQEIAGSGAVPGKNYLDLDSHGDVRLAGTPEEKNATFSGTYIDAGFVETYDLEVIAGRNFSSDYQTDKDGLLITESALPLFELNTPKSALGKKVDYEGQMKTIVGVLSDYHHKSLKHAYEPMAFRYVDFDFLYITLGLNLESRANVKNIINKVKTAWEQQYPNDPLSFFFLDQHFNDQYLADQRLATIFLLFSCLAIFIACLGLLGLASYVMTTRTKEIGIRKVLGASVAGIVGLLSKDFLKLVLVAILIAIPIAWYFMDQWLMNFPYRMDLHWWIFLLAGLAAISIAFLTVSIQSIQAAIANPIDALRNE